MVSITLSVPKDMKKEMDGFPEINWSAIARESIKKRLVMMEQFREFAKEGSFAEDSIKKKTK